MLHLEQTRLPWGRRRAARGSLAATAALCSQGADFLFLRRENWQLRSSATAFWGALKSHDPMVDLPVHTQRPGSSQTRPDATWFRGKGTEAGVSETETPWAPFPWARDQQPRSPSSPRPRRMLMRRCGGPTKRHGAGRS